MFEDGSLSTPPLEGTILPGITRASLIELAKSMGLMVREERYSIDQWAKEARSGRLREAFACGTAAVVASIGKICGENVDFVIGTGDAGPTTLKLKEMLVGIQAGTICDERGWVRRISPIKVSMH